MTSAEKELGKDNQPPKVTLPSRQAFFAAFSRIAAVPVRRASDHAQAHGGCAAHLGDEALIGLFDCYAEMPRDLMSRDGICLLRKVRAERRVVAHLPSKMIVVDRATALLSVSKPSSEGFLVLVLRQEGLVAHCLASFEHVWERARAG